MKKTIVLILMILAGFIMQSTVFQYAQIGGVAPNILLIITSCVGFMRGQNDGMLTGFLSGLLIDIFFGGGILGLYAFIYMIIGYMNGIFHRVFYPEDLKLPILFVFISDISYSMIIYVFMFMLRSRMDFFSYAVRVILPESVYTILIAIIIYRPLLGLNNMLEKSERGDSDSTAIYEDDM